jgi:hypothetical protein
MKAISVLLVAAVLAGCAAERSEPPGPPAQVTVHREPSSRDSLFPLVVAVDGVAVTRLYPGDARVLEIPAGDHRLEYELGVYSCAAEVRLEAGRSYTYRLARGCVIELDDGSAAGPPDVSDPGEWTVDEEEPEGSG